MLIYFAALYFCNQGQPYCQIANVKYTPTLHFSNTFSLVYFDISHCASRKRLNTSSCQLGRQWSTDTQNHINTPP